MTRVVLLDAGPLGMVSHPRPNPGITDWLRTLLQSGARVFVPEIADYEVRRELLRLRKIKSVQRLDQLKAQLGYIEITTAAMLKAAEFWASARQAGQPTASPDSLDADVILAAQAATFWAANTTTIIATTNVGHLSRYVDAQPWHDIA